MEIEKTTEPETTGAADAEALPSEPTESETIPAVEIETDASKSDVDSAVTQNGEVEQQSEEVPDNAEEASKPAEVLEASADENKDPDTPDSRPVKTTRGLEASTDENKDPDTPDSRPVRTTRGTKRKANDADENENMSNTVTNENNREQKENADEKSQNSEQKETDKVEEPSLKSLSADGMGKGKRARIPNKRYSDIILSPNRKVGTHQKSFADMLEPDMSLAIKDEPVDPILPNEAAVSSPSLPKRSRSSLSRDDLQDPKYLKPFKYGWRRELVWRSTSTVGKRLGDIYYFNPEGKKLRSAREVSVNLNNKHLSLDNFTFTKEPLGVNDPKKEIIRDAKVASTDSSKIDLNNSGKGKKRGPATPTDSPLVGKRNAKQIPVETAAKPTPLKKKVKMPIPNKDKETPPKRPKLSGKVEDSPTEPPATQPSRSSPRKTRTTEVPAQQTAAAAVAAATSPPPKPIKRGLKLKNITNNAASTSGNPDKPNLSPNFLGDCASIFNSLLHVFQYLKVQDLLRAGCVSRMWRAMADNPLLWRTVRMKNSQVHSFEGLANALKKHGTVHLDLRKMLLPSNGDDIWPDFSSAIARVDSLKKIEFCRCPASVVEQLATSNPNLEVINAVTIKCESLNLDPFKSLTAIRELRLKSTSGLNINSIDSLRHLKMLKILSLTSVIDLHKLNLAVIGELTNLESLDLGECLDFPETFGPDILLKLDKLEKLRLEKGQGDCHTFQILESIKDMKKLEQLELVNFDVKSGFDKALGACKNIKKLMIIPTYISQSATTNNMVLAGVLRLQGTLAHFVWGVTLELLRVTELFIDQCEDTNRREKKLGNNGDCIPVLKPVPDLSNGNTIQSASNPPQVEILPLPNLQKLLLNSLPTTRVKILKIPFHATWRQTLIDSM